MLYSAPLNQCTIGARRQLAGGWRKSSSTLYWPTPGARLRLGARQRLAGGYRTSPSALCGSARADAPSRRAASAVCPAAARGGLADITLSTLRAEAGWGALLRQGPAAARGGLAKITLHTLRADARRAASAWAAAAAGGWLAEIILGTLRADAG